MMSGRSFQNYLSLTMIQAANAVLPLIIFPIVLSRFGSEEYTRIVVSEAILLLVVAAVLYSFDLVGVRAIVQSDHRTDKTWLSALFFDVLITRVLIFCAVMAVLLPGIWAVRPALLPYALGWVLVPLSYAIQPNWFYQAHERNLPLAVVSFVSRAFLLIYVVLMMPDTLGAVWIPAIIGAAFISGAVASLMYCIVAYGLVFTRPPLVRIMHYLWTGKEIFLSNFSVSFYRDSNVLIMEMLSLRSELIALYSLAEKFIKVVQAACRPLNQLFYPRVMLVAKSVAHPSVAYLSALVPLVWPQLAALTCIWMLIVAGAVIVFDPMLLGLTPDAYRTLLGALMGMGIATYFGVCNFMLGAAGLNAVGYNKTFLSLVLGTGILSLTVNVILISVLGFWGAVIAFGMSEGILLCLILGTFLNNGWFGKLARLMRRDGLSR